MMKVNDLNENIALIKKDQYYTDDTIRLSEMSINPYLMICINLNGNCKCHNELNSYNETITKNHTIVDIVNNNVHTTQTEKNTHCQFLALTIQKEFLHQNLPQNKLTDKILNFFESKKIMENIINQRTNPKSQTLALEIFNNPYTNNLEKLYTESKVLELIYTEFTSMFQENSTNINQNIKFSNQDKEAIYQARDILMNNLQNPPSMKELARMVSINDLKLKVGFHKYFNETPYNISLEHRLQESKKLLNKSSNDLNISEISKLVGYKYASNFTQAFTKRFGTRPKDFVKSRKYY